MDPLGKVRRFLAGLDANRVQGLGFRVPKPEKREEKRRPSCCDVCALNP